MIKRDIKKKVSTLRELDLEYADPDFIILLQVHLKERLGELRDVFVLAVGSGARSPSFVHAGNFTVELMGVPTSVAFVASVVLEILAEKRRRLRFLGLWMSEPAVDASAVRTKLAVGLNKLTHPYRPHCREFLSRIQSAVRRMTHHTFSVGAAVPERTPFHVCESVVEIHVVLVGTAGFRADSVEHVVTGASQLGLMWVATGLFIRALGSVPACDIGSGE